MQGQKERRGVDRQGREDARDDGSGVEGTPKVAASARSRKSLMSRHDSTEAYGRYGVDLASDLYDGLVPMDVAKEVAKVDATHQRKIEHDLRKQVFAHHVSVASTVKAIPQ